jgi:hypothetical protein
VVQAAQVVQNQIVSSFTCFAQDLSHHSSLQHGCRFYRSIPRKAEFMAVLSDWMNSLRRIGHPA